MAEEVEDEAVIDCWEDFEENPGALEQQLKKMSVKEETDQPKQTEEIMVADAENRSSPFISQEPKIMILRRPRQSTEAIPNGVVEKKPKLPVKTLQQRQAAYAEARLRILGNTGPSDESKLKMLQPKLIEQGQGGSFDEANFQGNVLSRCSQSDSCKPPNYTMNNTGNSRPVAVIKPSTSSVNVRITHCPLMQYSCQPNAGNSSTS